MAAPKGWAPTTSSDTTVEKYDSVGHGSPNALAPLIDKNYRARRSAAVGYIHGLPQQA